MGCRLHGKKLEALALHNSPHNGLPICTHTHTINTTYSTAAKAGQDGGIHVDGTNQSQLVFTTAGWDSLKGRLCMSTLCSLDWAWVWQPRMLNVYVSWTHLQDILVVFVCMCVIVEWHKCNKMSVWMCIHGSVCACLVATDWEDYTCTWRCAKGERKCSSPTSQYQQQWWSRLHLVRITHKHIISSAWVTQLPHQRWWKNIDVWEKIKASHWFPCVCVCRCVCLCLCECVHITLSLTANTGWVNSVQCHTTSKSNIAAN